MVVFVRCSCEIGIDESVICIKVTLDSQRSDTIAHFRQRAEGLLSIRVVRQIFTFLDDLSHQLVPVFITHRVAISIDNADKLGIKQVLVVSDKLRHVNGRDARRDRLLTAILRCFVQVGVGNLDFLPGHNGDFLPVDRHGTVLPRNENVGLDGSGRRIALREAVFRRDAIDGRPDGRRVRTLIRGAGGRSVGDFTHEHVRVCQIHARDGCAILSVNLIEHDGAAVEAEADVLTLELRRCQHGVDDVDVTVGRLSQPSDVALRLVIVVCTHKAQGAFIRNGQRTDVGIGLEGCFRALIGIVGAGAGDGGIGQPSITINGGLAARCVRAALIVVCDGGRSLHRQGGISVNDDLIEVFRIKIHHTLALGLRANAGSCDLGAVGDLQLSIRGVLGRALNYGAKRTRRARERKGVAGFDVRLLRDRYGTVADGGLIVCQFTEFEACRRQRGVLAAFSLQAVEAQLRTLVDGNLTVHLQVGVTGHGGSVTILLPRDLEVGIAGLAGHGEIGATHPRAARDDRILGNRQHVVARAYFAVFTNDITLAQDSAVLRLELARGGDRAGSKGGPINNDIAVDVEGGVGERTSVLNRKTVTVVAVADFADDAFTVRDVRDGAVVNRQAAFDIQAAEIIHFAAVLNGHVPVHIHGAGNVRQGAVIKRQVAAGLNVTADAGDAAAVAHRDIAFRGPFPTGRDTAVDAGDTAVAFKRQVAAGLNVTADVGDAAVVAHRDIARGYDTALVIRELAARFYGEVVTDRDLLNSIHHRVLREGQVMAGGDLCCLFRLDVAQGNIAFCGTFSLDDGTFTDRTVGEGNLTARGGDFSVNLSAGRTLAYNVLDIPRCRQGRFTVDIEAHCRNLAVDRRRTVHKSRGGDVHDAALDSEVGICHAELSQSVNRGNLDRDVVFLSCRLDEGSLRDRSCLVFRGLSAFLIADDDERTLATYVTELHGAGGLVFVDVVVLDVRDVEGVLLAVGQIVVAVEDDELGAVPELGLHLSRRIRAT